MPKLKSGYTPPTPDQVRELVGEMPHDQFAALAGVTRDSVTRWLSGRTCMPEASYRLALLELKFRAATAGNMLLREQLDIIGRTNESDYVARVESAIKKYFNI